ncbi:MAG: hypothetical protein ACYC9L_06640 [Sulfuricaulis sp.]
MNPITHEQFNSALARARATPISQPAFQALLGKLGPQTMGKLLEDTQTGNASAIAALQRYGATAGLFSRLGEVGVNATIEQARAILQNHPIEDVRTVVAKAIGNDANARLMLSAWVKETIPNSAPAMPSLPPPASNVTHLPGPPAGRGGTTFGYDRPPTTIVRRVDTPASSTDAPPRQIAPRTYDQAKAHGGRAALTFQADTTTAGDPTVMIEVAPMLNRDARTYDWSNKVKFQLTKHELQLVTALLFDMVPQLHFSNHNEKWASITRQDSDPKYGGTIKFTIGVGKASQNQPMTVQVDSSSLGEITSLFVRQSCALLKADGSILPALLRQVAKTYLTQQACRNGSQAPARAAG